MGAVMKHRSHMPEFSYKKRHCLVCDSNDFEVLYESADEFPTTKGTYVFESSIVICIGCGFIFANPCPTQSSLEEYYRGKYLHSVGSLDYSMSNRMSFLAKHAKSGDSVMEFGGGGAAFLQALSAHGYQSYGVELKSAAHNEKTGGAVATGRSADVAVANHVFEHVEDVGNFLKSVRAALKPEGLFIVEVPNLHAYPATAWAISCEHVIHFSPGSLLSLLTKHGFEIMDLDFALTSRPFAFTVVARASTKAVKPVTCSDYLVNKAYFMVAADFCRTLEVRRQDVARSLAAATADGTIVLWGANAEMVRFLAILPTAAHPKIMLVDASEGRWGTSVDQRFGLVIQAPTEISSVETLSKVLICAASFESQIRGQLSDLGIPDSKIEIAPTAPLLSH